MKLERSGCGKLGVSGIYVMNDCGVTLDLFLSDSMLSFSLRSEEISKSMKTELDPVIFP